jgi:methylglutaconyl-CoA hydratase
MTNKATLSIQNAIAIITLNDIDKKNMLSAELRAQVLAYYDECEKDTSIQIIILNANGKHFCAGADLNEMLTMANAPFEENLKNAKSLAHFFQRIYLCQKPTIACVHGKTIGGGIGLAAVNDICIVQHSAEFCFPEVKLGLFPAVISPFVTHRIGFAAAQSLMLTADFFNATTAHEIKLADLLCEEDPINTAFLYAEKLLKNNLEGMQATKKWLRALHPISQKQIDEGARLLATIRSSATVKQALTAKIK